MLHHTKGFFRRTAEVWRHLQGHHLHHEVTVVLLLHLLLEELREALPRHQTHVVTLGHAEKTRRMSRRPLTAPPRGDGNSLLKEREVDQELRDVDHALQAEVILAAEERIGTLGLEGHVEHLVPKRQRV